MAQICVYAAGGASINICKKFHQPSDRVRKEEGFAEVSTVFIDTSRSNLPPNAEKETYLVKAFGDNVIDGSGKVRSTNYPAVAQAVPEILHQFKPKDLNIVVHSASGGSGSVIGPAIVSELLNQDKTVVVIQIGSTACEQEIRNTINTIMSYQSIASKRNRPVVSIYVENSKAKPMSINDATVQISIMTLAAVWSGENQGLDRQDLVHFLNYDKVSKYSPALVGLQIYDNNHPEDIEKGQAVSSSISLIRPGEDPTPDLLVSYHSFGYLNEKAYESFNDMKTPLHMHTVQGFFGAHVQRLEGLLKQAEEMYRVNPVNVLNVKTTHGSEQDDGMIL